MTVVIYKSSVNSGFEGQFSAWLCLKPTNVNDTVCLWIYYRLYNVEGQFFEQNGGLKPRCWHRWQLPASLFIHWPISLFDSLPSEFASKPFVIWNAHHQLRHQQKPNWPRCGKRDLRHVLCPSSPPLRSRGPRESEAIDLSSRVSFGEGKRWEQKNTTSARRFWTFGAFFVVMLAIKMWQKCQAPTQSLKRNMDPSLSSKPVHIFQQLPTPVPFSAAVLSSSVRLDERWHPNPKMWCFLETAWRLGTAINWFHASSTVSSVAGNKQNWSWQLRSYWLHNYPTSIHELSPDISSTFQCWWTNSNCW